MTSLQLATVTGNAWSPTDGTATVPDNVQKYALHLIMHQTIGLKGGLYRTP